MSYSHNKRRKTIKQHKKKFGNKWYLQFKSLCNKIRKEKAGEFIGSLEDLSIKGVSK